MFLLVLLLFFTFFIFLKLGWRGRGKPKPQTPQTTTSPWNRCRRQHGQSSSGHREVPNGLIRQGVVPWPMWWFIVQPCGAVLSPTERCVSEGFSLVAFGEVEGCTTRWSVRCWRQVVCSGRGVHVLHSAVRLAASASWARSTTHVVEHCTTPSSSRRDASPCCTHLLSGRTLRRQDAAVFVAEWKMRREPEVPEAEAQVGKWLDCRARITSKELAPIHSVKNGILQNACSTSPKMDADLGKSALVRIARLMNSVAKGLKRMVTKVQWLWWKLPDNWVAYFRIWSRRSTTIFRKSSNILKPIRCVQLTEAVLRHANIRDQNPSLGMICPGDPHQRNPNAPQFEDRSQEETEWQERCAREAAWRLAKNILEVKEKHKTAFFSPSENWCLPAPSTL